MAQSAAAHAGTSIGHVLACLGGSPWLESQVETVAALVRSLGARASVLHVAPRSRAQGVDQDAVQARIVTALALHGLAADLATVTDDAPVRAILRAVDQRGVDLVYAGAAPHESLTKDLLGSTARRIARSARCSVLLDSEPVGRSGSFPVAVVAVTFDQESLAMAHVAQDLARSGIVGRLHLVHEVLPAPASALRGDDRSAWTITRARADTSLRDFAAALSAGNPPGEALDETRFRPRVACVEGRDYSGVLEYATKVDASLVVCRGPRARRVTFWRWFGSEHETLLTDLPSALLLVRGVGTSATPARLGWR